MEKQVYALGVIVIIGLLVIAVLPRTHVPVQTQTYELQKFGSYDELKNFVNSSSSVYSSLGGFDSYSRQGDVMMNTAAESALPSSVSKSSDSYSTTNVQVAGVDEADIVKNDGRYIYTVSGNKVVIVDAYPAENARIISQINFNNSNVQNIFINGNKLVVFGSEDNYYPVSMGSESETKVASGIDAPAGFLPPHRYYQPNSFIQVYDVSDRSQPRLARNITASGSYFDSRMIGDYVYVMTSEYVYNDNVPIPYVMENGASVRSFPDIYYFPIPDRSYNYVNIVALNLNGQATEKTFMMPSSQTTYVSKDNIYLTYQRWLDYSDFTDRIIDVLQDSVPQLSQRINEIRSYNISSGSRFIEIGNTLQEYGAGLTQDERNKLAEVIQEKMIPVMRDIEKEREKTYVSKISINGGEINFAGQGAVPGNPLNQFSMDEHNGYFRIATTTTNQGATIGLANPGGGVAVRDAQQTNLATPAVPSEPTSTNNIYVLDSSMKTVGKLEGVAPGESIYAVRFIGDRAYMVTFQHVDPLFVIDLSSPESPKILGKLKIPGYSDYLHPYDETHLIGIGHEVDASIDADKVHSSDAVYYTAIQGVKISIFDVSDVSNPVEMYKTVIGDRGTSSLATTDHKAFLFDKDKQLLVVPMIVMERKANEPINVEGDFTFQGAYVYNIDLQHGLTLKGRITHMNSTETEDMKIKGYWYAYGTEIQRSLYIGNTLYTLSDKMIKANDLATMNEINKVDLPYEGYYGGPIIY